MTGILYGQWIDDSNLINTFDKSKCIFFDPLPKV